MIIFRTIIFLLFCFLPSFSFAENYQQSLMEKSRELDLASDEEWLQMVYYQKNIFGNQESIFDSPNFFLSSVGKKNPKAELEATIASFFNNDFLPFKDVYDSKQTSQCAFKGRYEWLRRKLNFDDKKLIPQKCLSFDKWYGEVNPKNAILIFSSSYLNNPASMFGHTFLLINNKDEKMGGRLVSQALNYSAKTTETNGIIFAYKGLFGKYQGQFSMAPYYKMIKKYNNSENRDLWEYDLKLNEEDLRKLMTNLWEINSNYANYYFFSENCSHLLLKMLQIVRPQIEDNNKIVKWVIPSDTVIDVAKVLDINEGSEYRPSRASKINHMSDFAGKKISKLAYKISQDKVLSEEENKQIDALEINQQKLLYDLSYEYLQYSYEKEDKFSRENMAKLSLKILKKRSLIVGKTNLPQIPQPRSNPLLAHDPARLLVSYGHNNIRKNFTQIDLRAAYHDLLDSEDGFLRGAQINVLDLSLQYFTDADHLKLNHFYLVDIKSYSPRTFLFKPLSWELKVGTENLYIGNQDFKTAAMADFGVGANFEIEELNSSISLLASGLTYYGENIPSHDIYALGPKLNIITDLNKRMKLNLSVRHNFFNNNFDYTEYEAKQNIKLRNDLSLKINFKKKDFENYRDDNEVGVGVNYYF